MDKPLWARLFHAAGRVEARLEAALEKEGVSLAKHGVLNLLAHESQPVPLKELAQRLSCVKSNVTQLVDRLEAEGLVERRRDDCEDKRSVRAALTPEGQRRWERSSQALDQAACTLLSGLANDELELLQRLLDKL